MFYIVETEDQLAKFSEYDLSESFIEPILMSDNYHPAISPVSAYFIKPFRSRTGFILPVNHSETFSLHETDILTLFKNKVKTAYTSDLKRSYYHLRLSVPIVCLKTVKWAESGEVLDDGKYNTVAHNFYYSKYPYREDVNRLIPIVKHQEKWNNYILDNKKLLNSKVMNKPYFSFYSTTVVKTLFNLESVGIKTDTELLSKHYPEVPLQTMLSEGSVYSHYNMFTSTGRPSNNFNGLNFGAMNKSDNSREFIVPKNDLLVEFDYHSYHLKILVDLIGYDFKDDDIHTHLGRVYFEKDELSEEEYSESKNITFKLLYTESNIEGLPDFFKKVRDYKNKLWKVYQEKGFIKSPLSKRPIYNIETKTQLLPYILQAYETDRNIAVMECLQDLLKGYKTKLIMYTYDSFLFDFDKLDGTSLLSSIQNILESDGYSTSVKWGHNYANLNKLTDEN